MRRAKLQATMANESCGAREVAAVIAQDSANYLGFRCVRFRDRIANLGAEILEERVAVLVSGDLS